MTNLNDYIEQLQYLGLTERESNIYLALLSRSGFTASELQKVVKIPSTKIYDVLKKLVANGLCTERYIDGVKFYEAVNPKIAFRNLVDKYKNEVDRKSVIAEQLIESFLPIFNENREALSTLDFIEIIKDADLIQKRYLEVLSESKEEILAFVKGPYIANISETYKNQQIDAEKNFIKKGGKVYCLYEAGELKKYELLSSSLKLLLDMGEKIRIAESLPMKMAVYDSRVVTFPLVTNFINSSSMTVIKVEHQQLAITCKTLFEFLWERSRDVNEYL